MKRIYIPAVALVAAFSISMLAVPAASAVEFLLALWLEGGANVTANLLVEGEGEIELRSLNAGNFGIQVSILCSGIIDGWIGPNSLGWASELLTLAGVLVPTTPLTGAPLLCTNDQNCTEPEVWLDVPIEGEIELMVDGTETFFVGLAFKAGYYIDCLILGITASELCEAEPAIEKLTNEANGTVKGETSDAFTVLAGGKLGNCTVGGNETAELIGSGILLETGVSLSVSSE